VKKSPKQEPQDAPLGVTCISRTVEAYDNQGFRNFRIVTLHIENGIVTEIQRSDPYANFEAIIKLELANELSIINLNNNWKNGKMLSK
jgi:hypothetical protein